MDIVQPESLQGRDHRVTAIELCGGRMRNVEHEVAAAVVVVADEGGAGRHTLHDLDQTGINAIGDEAIEDDLAKGIIADRADKDAGGTGTRRLIDEDAGRAGRKRTLVSFDPADGGRSFRSP